MPETKIIITGEDNGASQVLDSLATGAKTASAAMESITDAVAQFQVASSAATGLMNAMFAAVDKGILSYQQAEGASSALTDAIDKQQVTASGAAEAWNALVQKTITYEELMTAVASGASDLTGKISETREATERIAEADRKATEALEEHNRRIADAAEMQEAFKSALESVTAAAGAVVAAIGAIYIGAKKLIGAFTELVQMAVAEEVSLVRLKGAVTRAGEEWGKLEEVTEDYIATMAKKTGVSDNEQRASLAQLITITGSYKTALENLPTALDMAATGQFSLSTATMLLGRIAVGSATNLSRYGIVLKEGASAAENLAEMQRKYAGAAEEYGNTTAGAFDRMNIAIGEIKEVI
ncbi:MAG: hypothetical protein M0R06_01095, partial [Sphaerochaeta sp.]|nr:hypothetical protein [Sphaerochaeta sp.]